MVVEKGDKRRSVLFILVDQMRADCLSRLGHACVQTPNLDRLAEDGVLFENNFAQCTPCGPSRASILTGLYMKNHRSVSNGAPLDERHTNIARESRNQGVTPILFGYTDTTLDPRTQSPGDPDRFNYENTMAAFETICRMDSRLLPWRAHLSRQGYQVPAEAQAIFYSDPATMADESPDCRLATPFPKEHSDTAFLFDQLMDHLRVRGNEPLLTLITPLRPHPPLIAPAPYNTMYNRSALPKRVRLERPNDEAERHPLTARLLALQRERGQSLTGHAVDLQSTDDAATDDIRGVYFGLITELDQHIGRLLDFLREQGRLDDTLIIFTSDHGELLGDHWLFGKRGYFDQTVHVPLIIRDPRPQADSTRGKRVSAFTEHVDLLPTIIEWLGGDLPAHRDGYPLTPFLHGQHPPGWRSEVYWEFNFRELADADWMGAFGLTEERCCACIVRDESYKYVHFPELPPLLFSIGDNPNEYENLYDDSNHQSTVIEYAGRMLNRRMAHCDHTLTRVLG